MNIWNCIELFLSLPKSFYVSARLCGLKKAIKLPVLVRYNTVLRRLYGSVSVNYNGGGRMRVGLSDGEGTLDRRNIRCVLEISGKIVVEDKFIIGRGSRICVGRDGVLTVNSMTNTSRLHIVCMDRINIGNNVLVAWDTTIMDSDMHIIKDVASGELKSPTKEIEIEDNVWIGTKSVILKGTYLPMGSIVGAGAVVSGKYDKNCSVIGGNPAKVLKVGLTRYE